MVEEQLENQLKLGNLEASVHGFNKSNSRQENQKANMTHLAGLQFATNLSNVSCDVIQSNPVHLNTDNVEIIEEDTNRTTIFDGTWGSWCRENICDTNIS